MSPDRSTPIGNEELKALRRRFRAAVARACPPWLANDAEDIAQAGFMQLVEKLKNGAGVRGFSSIYLSKAARGVVVDEVRRRYRRREFHTEERQSVEFARSNDPDPERESASREIGEALRDCIKRLLDSRRLPVTLYLRGCSVPEVGRRLHWTPKKTESLVFRGLKDLRLCLSRKGLAP
jgi:RNA polymerase sigma-70 factor (ECF subfamily)